MVTYGGLMLLKSITSPFSPSQAHDLPGMRVHLDKTSTAQSTTIVKAIRTSLQQQFIIVLFFFYVDDDVE